MLNAEAGSRQQQVRAAFVTKLSHPTPNKSRMDSPEFHIKPLAGPK
jgi:hypothetical protein